MKKDLKGKVVLITGATSGIGRAAAAAIAARGPKLYLTARDMKAGRKVAKEIKRSSNNKEVHLLKCDLGIMADVKKCCGEFLKKEDYLHVLVLNAGIWPTKRTESKEGIELTWAVNYLSPVLMTDLLMQTLHRSAPARVLYTTSGMHMGPLRLYDPEFKKEPKKWSGPKAYGQSKLAIILHTRRLAENLAGTGISVNCIHPGMVRTNLARDYNTLMRTGFLLLGKAPEKGAETLVYLATKKKLDITGEYWAKKKVAKPRKEAVDMNSARDLHRVTQRYLLEYTKEPEE